jgi:hypothetical protein
MYIVRINRENVSCLIRRRPLIAIWLLPLAPLNEVRHGVALLSLLRMECCGRPSSALLLPGLVLLKGNTHRALNLPGPLPIHFVFMAAAAAAAATAATAATGALPSLLPVVLCSGSRTGFNFGMLGVTTLRQVDAQLRRSTCCTASNRCTSATATDFR